VSRVDHHGILVAEQDLVERVVHLGRVGDGVLRAEQVGPSDRPDQERAAGQQQEGLIRARGVRDCVAHVLGGVARRIERSEADRPHLEDLAVVGRAMLVTQLGARPDEMRGASQRRKVPPARDVVVVEMRLDDMRDAHTRGGRGTQVDVDVAPRIDHRGDARLVVDDQRREVAESLDPVLGDTHPTRLLRAGRSLRGDWPMLDSPRPERPRPPCTASEMTA
jgi:hypothetical protein